MRYATAAAMIGCAGIIGCGSASAASGPAAHAAASSSPTAITTRALSSPGCSTATATAPKLSRVRTAMTGLSSNPFGVAATSDGRWAFVSLGSSVEVLRIGTSLAPAAVRSISVPAGPAGETLTSNGRYLLAAAGSGAVVIDVARAERGTAGAVIGTLSDPAIGRNGGSAIEVALSPGDEFAFVTNEYSDLAAVFNLRRALTSGFGKADYVGSIPLGQAAVGMAVSPDGRWLYATSEVAARAGASNTGTLTVISLRKAETDPAGSVVATVDAGCNPVRVITSANGSQVWVDARASDDVLCFSAARLVADPSRALVSVTRVGELPVGLMLVKHGTQLVIADSNRFSVSGAVANLAVVNVAAALAGRPAVVGYIPAGLFPREMALEPGGRTLLVTNYASDQLEAVSVPTIP
jgi:DNA-binding beta-propeller fold protein YncE